MLSNENRTLVIPIYKFELAPMMDITAIMLQFQKIAYFFWQGIIDVPRKLNKYSRILRPITVIQLENFR